MSIIPAGMEQDLVGAAPALSGAGTGGTEGHWMHSEGNGGSLGGVQSQGGFEIPIMSMEVSELPLLVGVCQLEWSHGSSIAIQSDSASISMALAERAITEWENSSKGMGEAGKIPLAPPVPSARQQCPREAGQGCPGAGPVSPWWSHTPFPSAPLVSPAVTQPVPPPPVLGSWPGFLSRVFVALTGGFVVQIPFWLIIIT